MKITETNLQFRNALTKRSKTNKIVTHHAAAKNCDAKTIHGWHLNNGWSGIGYHFVVRKDGTIERGRPIDKVGAHCSGHNSDTIGICFEGNFQEEKMSDVQLKAGQELIAYLLDLYKLKKSDVVGHRDLMATSCPGKNFPFADMVNGADKVLNTDSKTTTTTTSKSTTHTVKKGDTLYSLAKKYNTTVDKLAKLNNLKFPYTLTIGKKLKLNVSAEFEFQGYNVKVTASSGLNIRNGAGESNKKLGAIPKGKKVYISKIQNGWGYTEYNKIKGWILLMYTKKA